jgi:hypothetical protein
MDSLAKLKAPTENVFMTVQLLLILVTFQDKTYETTSFDHGFPPKEIKKL